MKRENRQTEIDRLANEGCGKWAWRLSVARFDVHLRGDLERLNVEHGERITVEIGDERIGALRWKVTSHGLRPFLRPL
jgi:hypothetical protein